MKRWKTEKELALSPNMSTPRIAPKRWLTQVILLVAQIVIPFITVNGNPFLRFDISLRTFFMAGVPVRIDQFYLVLFLTLAVLAGFLLLTVSLGRVWCGWLCPQTVLNDLADLFLKKFQRILPPKILKLGWHLVAVLIAISMSAITLSWFQSPAAVIRGMTDFQLHPVIFSSCIILTALIYLDIVLVRRSFCVSYCPYGRMQTALMDQGTLNLAFLEETRNRCLKCSACVAACPMDIDIRSGFQIECISCGRCIDACRTIMDRRDGSNGLIAYRFGTKAGEKLRIGTKTFVLLGLTAMFSVAVGLGITNRSSTAFLVQKSVTAETKIMPDGTQIQPWRATIGNRGATEEVYSIRLTSQVPDLKTELLGPVSAIRIAPNENQQISFSIRFSNVPRPGQKMELRLDRSGAPVATVQIQP
jgi:cytochrome c oxidase accessory protein FixG